MTSFPLDHPTYTSGSVYNSADAIQKIQAKLDVYGPGKYVNFVGLKLADLPEVQKAFPDYIIKNTAGEGFTPYYEMRPRK